MKILRYIVLVLLLTGLSACGGKAPVKPAERFDAEKSFEKANKLVDDKKYDEARAIMLEVKNRDLSKKFAPLAQLRIADSYVSEGETELAVTEYRKFLEIYPDHRHAAYAQYQIAMVYFNEIESPERGYSGAQKALAEFEKLKADYPRNPYKDLIEIRTEKCRNIMAEYEFIVGDFYLKNGSYNAAAMRFETLLKKFPDYKNEAKVLLSLGIAYKKQGEKEKAEICFKHLIEKYPNLPLASDAKKELASLNSAKKEPAAVKSPKTEPVPTEPLKKEPAAVKAVSKEAVPVKSIKEEPASVAPAMTGPAPAAAVKNEPAPAEPAKKEPVQINEGAKLKIKKIIIDGNKYMTKSNIRKVMKTGEWSLLSYMTSSGYYRKNQLDSDIAKIKDLYLDNGFIKSGIGEPEIKVDNTNKVMTISINITEGDQYKISSVAFAGNKAFNNETLMKTVSMVPGNVFNKSIMQKDIAAIKGVYSKNNSLVSITPDLVLDDNAKTVQVLFNVEEGHK